MRLRLIVALVLSPATCDAQQVFKCVGGEAVVYQSAPCTAGQVQAKTWTHGDYAPPADADVERLRQVQQATPAERRTVGAPRGRRATRPVVPRGSAGVGSCDAEKARRDRALYKAGLRVPMAQRRAWTARIAAACRW
ncbi:hypothetical protein [Pseudoxanthomonas sp. 10H]|uniref:hypothetical protein n=1 Tax=Pseudoxanthomonas sp. 10H TaxID=3242729 RepID=UPI003558C426